MLLIYTPQSTTRLQYICKFIFEEILHTSYSLTIDEQNFDKYEGYKINYSHKEFKNSFQIAPHGLLSQNGIQAQQLNCFKESNFIAFFKTNYGEYSFDIFSASFYLISRYEEYLPHEKDMYGRYAHQNSLAFKESFINIPLVNIWIDDFGSILKKSFPTLIFQPTTFNFRPSYDIDIAWSYKEKGTLRNIGGFLKKPSLERLSTLLGKNDDPFDCYDFLDDLHVKYHLKPLYFFLVAKENGQYDKNILPDNEAMQMLIKSHAEKYDIGIHPSWNSFNEIETLKEEKNILEKISNKNINNSRQHYIKFNLPEGYRRLIDIGIKHEYSMGYGTINGFRASVASSFWWYDLLNEKITPLRIHPFCFMDATCFYKQNLSVDESYKELLYYSKENKKVNGEMISIFHNNFLGAGKEFTGWQEMYKKFISQVQQ
jgi:hypothetical protein